MTDISGFVGSEFPDDARTPVGRYDPALVGEEEELYLDREEEDEDAAPFPSDELNNLGSSGEVDADADDGDDPDDDIQ